jgi:methylmalonyl-CoA carboxyltransferase 12S subunit
VALNLTDFIVMAVLVGAGCGLSFVGLWMMLRQTGAGERRTAELELSELRGELKALEARVAAFSQPLPVPAAEATAANVAIKPVAGEEVTPELLVVIAAAVTAFLGKKVRIRSAKVLLQSREAANPWSQQGRMLIHASHNLRRRG